MEGGRGRVKKRNKNENRTAERLPHYVDHGIIRFAYRNQDRQEELFRLSEEDDERRVHHVSVQRLSAPLCQPRKLGCTPEAHKNQSAAQRACGYFNHNRQAVWYDADFLWKGGKRKGPHSSTA